VEIGTPSPLLDHRILNASASIPRYGISLFSTSRGKSKLTQILSFCPVRRKRKHCQCSDTNN